MGEFFSAQGRNRPPGSIWPLLRSFLFVMGQSLLFIEISKHSLGAVNLRLKGFDGLSGFFNQLSDFYFIVIVVQSHLGGKAPSENSSSGKAALLLPVPDSPVLGNLTREER